MVKLKQALVLDPPTELHFAPPFTEDTKASLKLTNPTTHRICFKLKTTAPKTYRMQPNSGIIAPQATATVDVTVPPIYTENPEYMKHKFIVQSLYAPDEAVDQKILWQETPGTDFMNSKLKCVFDVKPSLQLQEKDAESDDDDMQDAENGEVGSASEVTAEVIQNASPEIPDELKKAQEENKQRKEEVKKLRKENATYKEEHLSWRRSKAAQSFLSQSATGPVNPLEMCQTPQEENSLYTQTNIIVSIVVLIAGIVLGMKFL